MTKTNNIATLPEMPEVPDEQKNQTIRLRWKKGYIGAPHAFVRSALFGTGRRRDIPNDTHLLIPANGQTNITIKGLSTLTTFDFELFCALMYMCWLQNTDNGAKKTDIKCSLGSIAAAMGLKRTTGTANNIFEGLRRLAFTNIEIDGNDGYFSGSLISLYIDKTQFGGKISTGCKADIYVNYKLQKLYTGGRWSALDRRMIKKLGRNNLAIWLYCFFASHKQLGFDYKGNKSFYYSADKLKTLSGANIPLKHFNQRLKIAARRVCHASQELAEDCNDPVVSFKYIHAEDGSLKMSMYVVPRCGTYVPSSCLGYGGADQQTPQLQADNTQTESEEKDPITEDAKRFDTGNGIDPEAWAEWAEEGEN